jgi:hypothetical protein
MEVFVKSFEGAVGSIDSSVGDVLQNKYFFIVSMVLILLLGSLNSTMINKRIFYLYDGVITRLALMGVIYYVSTKNVPLAILLLSAILVSMNTYNKYKFNLLLMSHINNNNFNDRMFQKLIIKMHKLKRIIRRSSRKSRSSRKFRSSRKSRRHSKQGSNKSLSSSVRIIKRSKKLDKLRRASVKKIFDSIKVILNSLKGSNKVPSKLTKLALKAKDIAKSLGKKTPKIVKEVAKKIKDIAVSKGMEIPKIVSQLSTTVGLSSILIPQNVIQKLLANKEITKDDANKLKDMTPKSILKLLKEREIYLLTKSKKISSRLVKKIVKRTKNPVEFKPVSLVPSSTASPVASSVGSPVASSVASSVASPGASSVGSPVSSVSPSVGSPVSSAVSSKVSSVSISPQLSSSKSV